MTQWPSIADIADKVQKGELRAIDLVEQALKTIEDKKDYQAIIATTADRALERAKAIDQAVNNGEQVGRLAGVPFIAKDNFLTFGSETTAASNILKGFQAPYQATAIERLEDAGAICVAKANLDAFAHGSSTENSDIMTTKNPVDPTKVPGGSSGGSAAAVILDMAPFALGTDTGGSIRLPAAFTGAVGYKPTYGLVSRSGVVAMASSTDVIGPITRTVEDTALVLDVLAGKDELDSTTIERDESGYEVEGGSREPFDRLRVNKEPRALRQAQGEQEAASKGIAGAKIGIIKEYMSEGLDPEVKKIIQTAIDKLKDNGANIQEISLPSLPLALAVYYIICPAEVSSNLSRYDGQRYGFSHSSAKSLEESYNWSRSEGFGKEAKRRIMIGTYVLSSGYYDAYYAKAQKVRTKLIQEFDEAFSKVDILLGPTAPVTAFPIGQNIDEPMQMYLTDIMTVAVNLVGIPAISLPAGLANSLPVGLQLIANRRQDRSLLQLAADVEGVLK